MSLSRESGPTILSTLEAYALVGDDVQVSVSIEDADGVDPSSVILEAENIAAGTIAMNEDGSWGGQVSLATVGQA